MQVAVLFPFFRKFFTDAFTGRCTTYSTTCWRPSASPTCSSLAETSSSLRLLLAGRISSTLVIFHPPILFDWQHTPICVRLVPLRRMSNVFLSSAQIIFVMLEYKSQFGRWILWHVEMFWGKHMQIPSLWYFAWRRRGFKLNKDGLTPCYSVTSVTCYIVLPLNILECVM